MPDSQNLAKAELRELSPDGKSEINSDKTCTVQFNPENLKVSFANQISKPQTTGDKKGKPPKQFVGPGTTKLSLQLWFDVSAPMPPGKTAEQDVRKLTEKVAYFITPKPGSGEQRVPPLALRFNKKKYPIFCIPPPPPPARPGPGPASLAAAPRRFVRAKPRRQPG